MASNYEFIFIMGRNQRLTRRHMAMKIHYRKMGQTLCGVPYRSKVWFGDKANTTTNIKKVTCKTCIRLKTKKMKVIWI